MPKLEPLVTDLGIKHPISLRRELGSLAQSLLSLDPERYAQVKSKKNKEGHWRAISLFGYSSDPMDILKPGVLGKKGNADAELQFTDLVHDLDMAETLDDVIDSIPGGKLDRVRVMRLAPREYINRHHDRVDKQYSKVELGYYARIHVPLLTTPNVRFSVWRTRNAEEETFTLKPYRTYFLNISKEHGVHNDSPVPRLHLVIDMELTKELLALINGE